MLGSDRRQKDSKEPGAETTGPGRSDTIMLIRTGAGHASRLSIPRDTVVEIPGHGMQKINAAHEFGGPAQSISVIEHWLEIPINHLVEVNFENFPQLIDAMGGVTYTGGCIVSRLDGGSSNGGYTLRLPAGTHHLDGKQALALARTRKNLCEPNETDIQREEHQQALFNDMKSRLMSPSSFLRLPLIAWNAPPAIISDMSGPELLAPVRGTVDRRHAAHGGPVPHRRDHPALRRRRPHRLRIGPPRGGGPLPRRLGAGAAGGTAVWPFEEEPSLPASGPWTSCPWHGSLEELPPESSEELPPESLEEVSADDGGLGGALAALSDESPSLLERPRLRLP